MKINDDNSSYDLRTRTIHYPKAEAEADIAGKFGEEAKVGYVTCDVSSRVQVESEGPFPTYRCMH